MLISAGEGGMISVIQPVDNLALLSQLESASLSRFSSGELYDIYRKCSLAVLNTGAKTDNSHILLDRYRTFEINVIQNERGVKLELINPPESAFVDGVIIRNIQVNLYTVLRDIVQSSAIEKMQSEIDSLKQIPISKLITNSIFTRLRLARTLIPGQNPNVAVCWGGHAINQTEYDYAYEVGVRLGLRKIDVCTGCGPGAMEAPMKGAFFGHALQGYSSSRFIGLTEPSIIAAEPPNPYVKELVIMPDIEKRLEAFVRFGNAIILFPGGPGSAEEFLYILSVKLLRENRHEPLPLILTGPRESRSYFASLDTFAKTVLGDSVSRYYEIIIDDPEKVARSVKDGLDMVREHRTMTSDSYCFNWTLKIPEYLQEPFEATHANISTLNLHRSGNLSEMASNLRRAFSAIVSGNVKEAGMEEIKKHGPFVIEGDSDIMAAMDKLLKEFIDQKRILLSKNEYVPCYTLRNSQEKGPETAN